ncbi:hypothetical protein DM860_006512 [Cuscuta australis]|uniref:Uncharacterized protein n=1 Tax=Cuscuta australis TaxID=267555 RepID=A0A328D3P8_9ASTE|nr:hypothetical protein DM860_006512 [Cuscuta australis]
MGRSASNCFKIITCASDSADSDGFDAPESKCSSDKRGWSFRKRSERHRVLSNTVIIAETQPRKKDSPEAAPIISQTQPDTVIPDKTTSTDQQLSSNLPDKTYSTEPLPVDAEKVYVKEPVQCTDEEPQPPISVEKKSVESASSEVDDHNDELAPKESDVIAIQAAVRGFLAQNSLMKHKNAVKLQAALRGHVVRRQAVGTLRCVQAIVKMQALVRARRDHKSSNLGMEHSSKKVRSSNASMEKILSNSFARQLLESSSPRTKTINIKCDPSKSDSAWLWLERWMTVPTRMSPIAETPAEQLEEKKVVEHLTLTETPSATNNGSSRKESVVPPERFISDDADSLSVQETDYKLEDTQTQGLISELGSFPCPSSSKDNTTTHSTGGNYSYPDKTETEKLDGDNFSFGSRNASGNLTFIAGQSKSEELSLSVGSAVNTTSLTNQETGTDYFPDAISSPPNNVTEHFIKNSSLHTSVLLVAGSECSTELSISSTLDSPDRYEIKVQEYEQETKTPSMDTAVVHHHMRNEDLDIDTREQTISRNELPNDEQKPEMHVVAEQMEVGSPRSHVTFPESQGTPPSSKKASSVKPKARIIEKSGSNSKNPNQDAAAAKSSADTNKDHKSGKRRKSFGSAKSEQQVDQQEHRDSNASGSLPSYMQATESAKAKAILNNSPRSSPDAHNKETYQVKKRHSLPGSNGRQRSPRIERSLSQAQQNTKGNEITSPHERRWQR